jgi:ubiquinone/menaquinone biosynthesis C-methylase UbiE
LRRRSEVHNLSDNLGFNHILPVSEAYDVSARFYDDWKWQDFWHITEAPIVLECLSIFLREQSRQLSLLDVGCGTGWYLSRLKNGFAQAVGVDVSLGMLSIARERAPWAEFVQADLQELPFNAPRFDAILCTRVLSHIPSARLAVAKIARVLRPGGIVIISSVDADHDYEQTKLPVGQAYVLAETFKHSREEVAEYLKREGLSHDCTRLITLNGEILSSQQSASASIVAPPVGWLSVWRYPAHSI